MLEGIYGTSATAGHESDEAAKSQLLWIVVDTGSTAEKATAALVFSLNTLP